MTVLASVQFYPKETIVIYIPFVNTCPFIHLVYLPSLTVHYVSLQVSSEASRSHHVLVRAALLRIPPPYNRLNLCILFSLNNCL